jgi:haloacetate dehalogenase
VPRRHERSGRGSTLPIAEALARCDARFARAWWHWFFLGQTDRPAERVISADPEAWYRPSRAAMGEENLADHVRAIHDPATVQAMWRTLVLWAVHGDMEDLYGDPVAV